MPTETQPPSAPGADVIRVLVDALKPGLPIVAGRPPDLSPGQWQAVLDLAAAQRVMPLFGRRLRQKGMDGALPPDARDALRSAIRRTTLRNGRLYGQLRELLDGLDAAGVPVILLKGIYLAGAVYEELGLREMNDLDLLVRAADLERAADAILTLGYRPLKPLRIGLALRVGKDLPRLVKAGRASVEVHWNVAQPGDRGGLDMADLWARARPVRVAGCAAWALAPEDLLLHLCQHASYHHQFAFGLRPYCDLAETIRRFGPALDWEAVVARARQWGWTRGVYLTLRLAVDLVGAGAPDRVLAHLRPADATDDLLDTARTQVFSDKRANVAITVSLAECLATKGWGGRLRLVWRRLVLTPDELADRYEVPERSWRLWLCYPRRALELLWRYGPCSRIARERDAALAARKHRLAQWLARPP